MDRKLTLLAVCFAGAIHAQIVSPIFFQNSAGPPPPPAAFSLVQSNSAFNFSSGGVTVTFSGNVTAHHLLVAFGYVNVSSARGATVNDASNGNWTFASPNADANQYGVWYVCDAVGGVAPAVTLSGNSGNWYSLAIMEFSGSVTTGCFDVGGAASGSSSPTSLSTSFGVNQSDLILYGVAMLGTNSTFTPLAGETSIENIPGSFGLQSNTFYNNAIVDNGVATMGATLGTAAAYVNVIAAFRLANGVQATFPLSSANYCTPTPCAASVTIPTTGATLIVAEASGFTSQDSVYTDSLFNSWNCLTEQNVGPGRTVFCYVVNPTTGPNHTITATGWSNSSCVGVFKGTAAIDQNSGNTASGTTVQPGSITPAATGYTLVTGFGGTVSGTLSINSSFSILRQVANSLSALCGIGYKIGTTSPENPTWTSSISNNMGTSMADFAHN